MTDAARSLEVGSLARRAPVFAVVWLILTEGDAGAWWVGLPVVLVAAYASLVLMPTVRLRPLALMRFLPLFFWRSLVGAWDVALRALRPGRPLRPGLADYEMSLHDGLARVFFANTVSLLPGTLSADIQGSTLRVHMLDDSPGARAGLQTLESAVAGLFTSEPGR
jgi:multicomponent Na+:H+ antiporter subunit E